MREGGRQNQLIRDREGKGEGGMEGEKGKAKEGKERKRRSEGER